jgi:hypothetical protein
MAPHSTNDFFAAIDPVVNRSYYGLGDNDAEKQYSRIFKVSSDDEPQRSFVEYGGPANLTLKTENAAVTAKTINQGPVKTHYTSTYAGAITISYEAAKDVKNRYGKIAQASSALGEAERITPELLTALYLDRAFNSSFPATADAIELCGVHVLPDGVTTFQNELATPAALDETAAEDVRVALRSLLLPSGNIRPTKVTSWIVPSSYEPIAMKLSQSAKTIGSANNDPSLVKGTEVKMFDYLGSSTRWFAETDRKDNGLFWDWIEKPQFITDQVVLMLQKVYVSFFRARFGCGDWRQIYGSAAT